MLSKYALTSTDFQEDALSSSITPDQKMYEAVNPKTNSINEKEYWKWTFMERE